MEDLYKMRKSREIGVSNFEKNHLEDIFAMNSLLPSVNQVEFHPYSYMYTGMKVTSVSHTTSP